MFLPDVGWMRGTPAYCSPLGGSGGDEKVEVEKKVAVKRQRQTVYRSWNSLRGKISVFQCFDLI